MRQARGEPHDHSTMVPHGRRHLLLSRRNRRDDFASGTKPLVRLHGHRKHLGRSGIHHVRRASHVRRLHVLGPHRCHHATDVAVDALLARRGACGVLRHASRLHHSERGCSWRPHGLEADRPAAVELESVLLLRDHSNPIPLLLRRIHGILPHVLLLQMSDTTTATPKRRAQGRGGCNSEPA